MLKTLYFALSKNFGAKNSGLVREFKLFFGIFFSQNLLFGRESVFLYEILIIPPQFLMKTGIITSLFYRFF